MRAVRLLSVNAPLAGCEIAGEALADDEVRISVRACGICRSDAHYRSGFGGVKTPRTPGHEVAGVVSEVGRSVRTVSAGDRVAVHYLRVCGVCRPCREEGEQFCVNGGMIGKHFDGGYAESVNVPAWNVIPVPDSVPLEIAAIMMCSTATAYHALNLAGMTAGRRVAVLGFGGLGISAAQLSFALGASCVAALDVMPGKLASAERLGALPVDGASVDWSDRLLAASGGLGFDIALDFTGLPSVSVPALRALRPGGRLVLVALSEAPMPFNPYLDVLTKERHILGCSDHLRSELFQLMALAGRGKLDLSQSISHRVRLEAEPINRVLDDLERGSDTLRAVISI